jgi:hypothetical protein
MDERRKTGKEDRKITGENINKHHKEKTVRKKKIQSINYKNR